MLTSNGYQEKIKSQQHRSNAENQQLKIKDFFFLIEK